MLGGGWFLYIVLALIVGAGLAVGAAVVLAVMLFVGGASLDACEPPSDTDGSRLIIIDPSGADAFQQKWDAFDATLDGGQPADVTFTENEVSSRAQRYLDENDAPISSPRICIHTGFGEAIGTVEVSDLLSLPIPLPNVDVKVTGRIDMSGAEPRAIIDDIEIGSLPGPMADRLKGRIRSLIDDQLEDLDLEHQYAPALRPGAVDIAGQP